jgi:hypothetical protein
MQFKIIDLTVLTSYRRDFIQDDLLFGAADMEKLFDESASWMSEWSATA